MANGHNKKWSRVEEADDILEQCYNVLSGIPIADLRKEHMWVPSREMVDSVAEVRDRVFRYMKRNHGWGNGH